MDAILIRDAIDQLKLARNNLRQAGAPAALEKVRSALKSAEGAQRHADKPAVFQLHRSQQGAHGKQAATKTNAKGAQAEQPAGFHGCGQDHG